MSLSFVLYRSRIQAMLCQAARRSDRINDKQLPKWAKIGINTAMMSAIVWIFISLFPWGKVAFVSLVAFVVGHEYFGHYRPAKKLGIPIEEVGLGIPSGWPRKLMIEVHIPRLPFRVMLSPLLIAAYVEEGEEGRKILKQKTYLEQARFFGGGVITHLVTVVVLLVLIMLPDWIDSNFSVEYSVKLVLAILVMQLLLKLFSDFPARFTAIIPFLGFGVVGLILYMIWPYVVADPIQAFADGEILAGQVLGPVSIVRWVSYTNNFVDTLILLLTLSLGLALTNMLPLKFVDGGQVFEALLEKWRWGTRVRLAIIVVVTLFVGGPLVLIVSRLELGLFYGLALLMIFTIMGTISYTLKTHRRACPLHLDLASTAA